MGEKRLRHKKFGAGAFFVAYFGTYYYSPTMQPIKCPKNRFVTRREVVMRQIASIGPFIEGTLVKLPRKDCRHVAHRLTFKVQGKTRAVYVPLDRVKDVETWTREYKRLKELIRSVTRASLGELRNHVRSRRANSVAQRNFGHPRPN
jgi:hypothetical protein